jgi:hypothetical protein
MTMPTPGNMNRAPAWDNYLVAQAVQASLGLIPRSALGIYITISDDAVDFQFQLAHVSEDDEADMADIVDNFTMLIGFVVPCTSTYRILQERELAPKGARVRWLFSHHQD